MSHTHKISIEYHTEQQIYERGKQLEGMPSRDVLDLGIAPPGAAAKCSSRRDVPLRCA